MVWRKAFDHNPLFEVFCDKLASKEWIASKCPDLPIPRTLWQGVSAREIPEALLAVAVIVKSNAASARNLILNGQSCDRDQVEKKIDGWLSRPYGLRVGFETHFERAIRRTRSITEAA